VRIRSYNSKDRSHEVSCRRHEGRSLSYKLKLGEGEIIAFPQFYFHRNFMFGITIKLLKVNL